jgi:uncharacterized protein
MAQKYYISLVRMCVVCRERFAQFSLLRLQCKAGVLCNPIAERGEVFICVDRVSSIKKLRDNCLANVKAAPSAELMIRLKEIIVNDG